MFVNHTFHNIECGLHMPAMEDGENCSHHFKNSRVFGFNHEQPTYKINSSLIIIVITTNQYWRKTGTD